MKKNLFITFSLMFIFLSTALVMGQIKIPYEDTFYPNAVSITQTKVTGKVIKTTNHSQGIEEIGMEVINDTTKNVYRTYYVFDFFGIPTNATIKEVKVIYTTNSTGYSFKLTHITSLGTTNSNNWTVIGTSGSVQTGLVYSGLNEEFISSTLKTKIQGLLTNHEIILGGLSESETTDGSKSDLTLSLHIKWERDAETYTVTAKNDMNSWEGGNIGVGVSDATSQPSPHTFSATETLTYKLKAFDSQYNDGYDYVYNDTEAPLTKSIWRKKRSGIEADYGSGVDQTFLAQSNVDNAEFKAYLRRICNVSMSSTRPGGRFFINGQYRDDIDIVEGNVVSVSASSETIDDIRYEFDYWADGDTINQKTFTIDANTNITANYLGYPVWVDRNLTFNTYNPKVEQYIQITWNEHPNTNVTKYEIWRRKKDANNNDLPSTRIGTVNRGTTTFTDYGYLISDGDGDDDIVSYDVRAWYQPDNTLSTMSHVSRYGESTAIEKLAQLDSVSVDLPKVEEYALNSNYPNPFNPTTQISYQLPKNSFVNLIVYNSLGQNVAELVNQHQSSGQYTVKFNASNLPSGVYIYKLQAGEFSDVKKMLLTK